MPECGNECRESPGEKSQRYGIDDVYVRPGYHDRRDGNSRPLSKIESHVIAAPACTETLATEGAQLKQMLKERLMLAAVPIGDGSS